MINTQAKTKFRLLKWGLRLIAIGLVEIFIIIISGDFNPHSGPTTLVGTIALFTFFPITVIGILLSIIAGIRAFLKGY